MLTMPAPEGDFAGEKCHGFSTWVSAFLRRTVKAKTNADDLVE